MVLYRICTGCDRLPITLLGYNSRPTIRVISCDRRNPVKRNSRALEAIDSQSGTLYHESVDNATVRRLLRQNGLERIFQIGTQLARDLLISISSTRA